MAGQRLSSNLVPKAKGLLPNSRASEVAQVDLGQFVNLDFSSL